MLSHFSHVRSLCDPMDCSLLGSSVRRISQARILEWVAISSSRGSSQPRDQACVSQFLSQKHLNTLKKKKIQFLELLLSFWPFFFEILSFLDSYNSKTYFSSNLFLLHLLLNIHVPLSTIPQDSSHLLMGTIQDSSIIHMLFSPFMPEL